MNNVVKDIPKENYENIIKRSYNRTKKTIRTELEMMQVSLN